MKNKLNTKNRIYIILIIVILTIVSSIFLINNKLSDNKAQLDEVKLKDIKDNNMFAIMVNDGSGKYTSNDQFPGDGYKFNSEKSGCMDNNNELIPDSLSFDEKEQKAIVNTGQTSYCYLYFDEVPQTLQTLQSKAGSGLSTDLVGGMYRYIGTNDVVTNNYICLSGVGSNGCGTSGTHDSMYRIIGITEEGNIKVIKQTKYNNTNYAWNTKFDENNSNTTYKCDLTSGCPEWPNSEIYTTLNTNFYNSLNDGIRRKIQEWNWWYGDIEYNYAKNLTGDDLYKIETGQKESQYYGKLPSEKGNAITTKEWDEQKTGNIGLMYLHDYYYQSNENGCHSSKGESGYNKCRDNGWMHLAQNGNSSDYEWTMSRVGRDSISSACFRAWGVYPDGRVNYDGSYGKYAVRPVFYLTSDIELEGEGTTKNPFYISK